MNHVSPAKSRRTSGRQPRPGRTKSPPSLRTRWREQWNALAQGRPGHRFQERYERNRAGGKKGGRVLRLLVGGIAILAGLTLMVIPGPGLPFVAAGAGLMATDSLPLAKVLDWVELRLRPFTRWLSRHWLNLPKPARVALMLGSTLVSITAAYLLPRLFSGG